MKNKQDGGARAMFKKNIPEFHWTPIETGALLSGVPDTEYCTPTGVTGWIEFKYWYPGKRCPMLRPAQIGWIEKRLRHNGRVFIGVVKGREVFVIDGKYCRDITESPLKPMDWKQAREVLGGKSDEGWPR
jgi:hypothetical protein